MFGSVHLCFFSILDSREVPFADQVRGTNNSFLNNTVISGIGQFFGACAGYDTSLPYPVHVEMDGNTYYSPGAQFSDGKCSGKKLITNFTEWQNSGIGQDSNSKILDLSTLSYDEMIAAGRKLLSLP